MVKLCYPLSAVGFPRVRESDCQTSDWHGTWKRIPYLRLVTGGREISGLYSAEMTGRRQGI